MSERLDCLAGDPSCGCARPGRIRFLAGGLHRRKGGSRPCAGSRRRLLRV